MMDELTNHAEAVGTYNLHETEIKSNSVTTILITNLEITKSANKFIWATGNLRYTITVSNPNSGSVQDIIINDILNPELIRLVIDSITINGVPAGYGNFTYNEETGLLSIFLNTINSNQNIEIEFAVIKHRREIFKLENYAEVIYGNNPAIRSTTQSTDIENDNASNIVVVTALSEVCRCKEIYNYMYENRNR